MLGDLILQRAAEALRKLRNTARFMLGNLAGFLPPEHAVGYADLMLLDRYMLHKLAEACAAITAAYDECARPRRPCGPSTSATTTLTK